MRLRWIGVLTVVLITFFCEGLYAQVPVRIGNNIDVSSGLTLLRGSPSAAYNSSNNEYMVVFRTGTDTFGQRLSSNGSLLGGNVPIAPGVGSQFGAVVSYNSIDNNYLFAWQVQFDLPGSPDFNDAFGRLVSNAGIPLGAAFRISDGGLEISSAYNSISNDYLVVGRSFASGPIPGIFGQIVSNAGSLVGTEIPIATDGAPGPNGQVIYNPTINEYFATWRDNVAQNLKGQRISSTGVLLGNPIIISPLFTETDTPGASIAFDPANNRYIIVFASAQGTEIWGQFVSSSGALIGSNFLIQTLSSPTDTPSVAHSSIDNVFFLVWRDGNNVIGQLLSQTGATLGLPLFIANGTAVSFEGPPQTVHNTKTGDFLVVWLDNRNVPQGEQDIFAQLVGIKDITPPVIINEKVSFVVQSTSFSSTPASGGPAGVFTITANLTNTSREDIPGLIEAFVSALTNGTVLLSATEGDGSVGSKQAINVGSDNKLSPNESVTVQFKIGLANRNPFVFLVDVTATQ